MDTGTTRESHRALTQLQVTHELREHQRAWFAEVRRSVIEDGAKYVLADGCTPHEIFVALDLPVVVDVWYSGLVAARRESAKYSQLMTDLGYHDGLSRYQSLGVGVMLDQSDAPKPWGGLPAPALIVGCPPDPSQEVLAAHFGVPCLGVEAPVHSRPDHRWWEHTARDWERGEGSERIDMLVAQFHDVIAAAERIAGRRLDIDRLRAVMELVNEQQEAFSAVRRTICESEKLPVRLGEVLTQVMATQWHRGTPWAVEHCRKFSAEVADRAERRLWVCPDERFRMMYIGEGLWQQIDFFAEFEEAGVVFPRSNYLSFAVDAYPRYGLEDPLRALAARYATFNARMHLPPWAGEWAVWDAQKHRIDGAILLERGAGRNFIARELESSGIPVMRLPVDPVDGRTWSTQRIRGLMEEFIQRLERHAA
jgi:benzoyl-CoA reductase subunit B